MRNSILPFGHFSFASLEEVNLDDHFVEFFDKIDFFPEFSSFHNLLYDFECLGIGHFHGAFRSLDDIKDLFAF